MSQQANTQEINKHKILLFFDFVSKETGLSGGQLVVSGSEIVV